MPRQQQNMKYPETGSAFRLALFALCISMGCSATTTGGDGRPGAEGGEAGSTNGGGQGTAGKNGTGGKPGGSGGTDLTTGGSGGTATGGTGQGGIATGGTSQGGNGGTVQGGSGGSGGTPMPTGKPVFLAQGYGKRLVVSCDAGRTWSFEIPGSGSNADHDVGSPHGVVWGNGVFVAFWGWGTPAVVEHSANGKDWVQAKYSGNSLSEPMFEGGYFVAGGGHVGASSRDGNIWTAVRGHDQVGNGGIVRAYGSGILNGKPVFVGSGAGRYVQSQDNGVTFQPGTGPAACGDNLNHESGDIRGAGDGQLFIVTNPGQVCRSTDGGKTWVSRTAIANGGITDVVFAGGMLHAFAGTRVSRSADGGSWTSTNLTVPGNVALAHVGYAADGANAGVWVAANTNGSQFFHSMDGITWTRAGGGRAGANISSLISGYVTPGGACP
jgi:hypothetical protein